MNTYLNEVDSVTEENKEAVVLAILEHLVQGVGLGDSCDIALATGIASCIDLNKVPRIRQGVFSKEAFSQLPESTGIRYMTDICILLTIQLMKSSEDMVKPSYDIDYTVSRSSLKEVASIVKGKSPVNYTVKSLDDCGKSVGDYNASVVIQYLLDSIRGTKESKVDSRLDKVFKDIVEGDYCIFLKDVKRVDCKLDDLDDYIKLTSHIISKCVVANAGYTVNKLVSIGERLPETLPVPIKSETYSSLCSEVKDTFFKAGSETTSIAIKICIIILNNLVSRSCDYVAIDTILNM